MSDIVDRLARIINPMAWNEVAIESWSPVTVLRQQAHARKKARAVLEAIREPTTEMQWAGYRAKEAVFSADALWNRDPANCFRAMIDAALSQANPHSSELSSSQALTEVSR